MQKHILLVDSDAASKQASQALLQHEYRVSATCSCDQCLAIMEKTSQTASFLMWIWKGTSDTIMYSRLRRNSRTKHIPAIVCTEDLLCSVEAALAS